MFMENVLKQWRSCWHVQYVIVDILFLVQYNDLWCAINLVDLFYQCDDCQAVFTFYVGD